MLLSALTRGAGSLVQCVCVYIFMYICTHTHTHTHTHTRTHTKMSVYIQYAALPDEPALAAKALQLLGVLCHDAVRDEQVQPHRSMHQ